MNLKMYGFLIIFTNLDFLNEGGFEILAIFSKNQIQHKNVKEGMVLSLFLFNKVFQYTQTPSRSTCMYRPVSLNLDLGLWRFTESPR